MTDTYRFFQCKGDQYIVSSAEPGLIVVFEGKRTRVRIFRRFFYPVQARDEEINVVVYSDTGQEREITYKRAENFSLDDPFKLVSMIRLARAMKVLKTDKLTNGVQNLRFTICKSEELIGSHTERDEWIPFDPTRMRPLDERIRDAKKRARWKQRLMAR